jgi:hypothetical protein
MGLALIVVLVVLPLTGVGSRDVDGAHPARIGCSSV